MGGKEGRGKRHIIIFRAGAHCARVLLTYRVGKERAEPGNREQKEGEQSADKGKTVLKGGENGGLRKGKQWFRERKTIILSRDTKSLLSLQTEVQLYH